MLCTRCDTRNEDGARFCRVCGIALTSPTSQPAASKPVYTFTNAPMTGPACPACTRANPSGACYCVYCAAALVRPTPISYAVPAMQPALAHGPTTNVVVNYVTPQPMQFVVANSGNLVIRAIWFVLIGWWLGLIWTIFAWLFNLTLIGLPVGLMMLNAIPQVMTLRPRNRMLYQTAPGGPVWVQRPAEHPLALRAIWFVLIGWWASLVWSLIAWAFSLTLLLMPISFWMWNRVPTITTLAAE
jgi:uncharacterized membrane protein YccF (DUF307 family)